MRLVVSLPPTVERGCTNYKTKTVKQGMERKEGGQRKGH